MISRIQKIDWDFPGDTCASPFSTIHWHPCRFVSQIPASIIGLLSSPGDVVLDPYSGSGTTVVEAQRLGRNGIGIDLNPIAILQAHSKILAYSSTTIKKNLENLQKEILIKSSSINYISENYTVEIPPSVQASKWYHQDTLNELLFLWDYINNSGSSYKAILLASFSSILLSACNETRHWGYVCDNTMPKSTRKVDAIALFSQALSKYINAYIERDRFLGKGVSTPLPKVKLMEGDSNIVMQKFNDESVDLIITSPPYFGVCDYIKSQRLSMEWFGLNIDLYRKDEIGARSKRHRINAAAQYLSEITNMLTEAYRLLKPNKYIALVIGESSSRKSTIDDIRQIIENLNFSTELSDIRKVPVQRRQNPSITHEHVLIARK